MTENFFNYCPVNPIDAIGSIIGLIYLYLEFTAKKSMWIASIIMAIFYVTIFYRSNLYAMSAIYVYFFVASIHGWLTWHQQAQIVIIRMPKSAIMTVALLIVIASISIYSLLKILTDGNQLIIVLGDTIATALSIVALWMASKRWAEQWCLLVPANLLTALLMLIQQEYASSLMFLIYFIVSIFGYFHWRKLSQHI